MSKNHRLAAGLMKKKIKRAMRYPFLGLLAFALALGFQNCVGGFNTNGTAELSSLAAASNGSDGAVTPTPAPQTNYAYRTTNQTIGTSTTAKTMSFVISTSKATLHLSIQNEGTQYLINNVSVAVTSQTLEFSGLHIWINGVESLDNTLAASSGLLGVNSTASFSGAALLITPAAVPTASDTIAVSFDGLTMGGVVVATPTPTPTPVPTATPVSSGAAQGAVLYANYCASCHGALGNSQHQGASVSDINFALNNISNMQFLQGALTQTQISEISEALQ